MKHQGGVMLKIILLLVLSFPALAGEYCDRSLIVSSCPTGNVCCLRDKVGMAGECSARCIVCGDEECPVGLKCCRWIDEAKKIGKGCRPSCNATSQKETNT